MDIYKEIYEFGASAGALEGYVYEKQVLDPGSLDDWVKNLVRHYHDLPVEVRQSFQPSLDRTIGRAVLSLIPLLGKDHDHVCALKALIVGEMPASPHDFSKEKEEKAEKYG
jgi:hypothetical protein